MRDDKKRVLRFLALAMTVFLFLLPFVNSSFADASSSSPFKEETGTDENGGKDEQELASILKKLQIELTPQEARELYSYLLNGGRMKDWLRENKGKDAGDFVTHILYLQFMEIAKRIYEKNEREKDDGPLVFEPSKKTDETESFTFEKRDPDSGRYENGKVKFTLGDPDADGKVTAADARTALRISASIITPELREFLACDMNGDGRVTAGDARTILRISSRLTKQ